MSLPDGRDGVVHWGAEQGIHFSARAATRATFTVRERETRGAYALLEWEHEPSAPGPPLHVHDGEEESFSVIRGKLSLVTDDGRVQPTPDTMTTLGAKYRMRVVEP